MLHHFPKVQLLNLKPILTNAIIEREISPYHLAYPLDYTSDKIVGERGN